MSTAMLKFRASFRALNRNIPFRRCFTTNSPTQPSQAKNSEQNANHNHIKPNIDSNIKHINDDHDVTVDYSKPPDPHKPRTRVFPGLKSDPLPIPDHIIKPEYVSLKNNAPKPLPNTLFAECKDEEQIKKMRIAAKIAAESLEVANTFIENHIKNRPTTPLTTSDIDYEMQKYVMSKNAYPVGVKFHGFPRAVCMSVNEVVVHGIPDNRVLQPGDIVNCDVSTYINGVFGDTSKMFIIGGGKEHSNLKVQKALDLIEATKETLRKAIHFAKPGKKVCDIGSVITEFAHQRGYNIVQEFTGHFIGRELHMNPNIVHYPNRAYENLILKPGMTFTIEPILAEKGSEIVPAFGDGWSYVTKDGGLSAQMEHTVLITEFGNEILTLNKLDGNYFDE